MRRPLASTVLRRASSTSSTDERPQVVAVGPAQEREDVVGEQVGDRRRQARHGQGELTVLADQVLAQSPRPRAAGPARRRAPRRWSGRGRGPGASDVEQRGRRSSAGRSCAVVGDRPSRHADAARQRDPGEPPPCGRAPDAGAAGGRPQSELGAGPGSRSGDRQPAVGEDSASSNSLSITVLPMPRAPVKRVIRPGPPGPSCDGLADPLERRLATDQLGRGRRRPSA